MNTPRINAAASAVSFLSNSLSDMRFRARAPLVLITTAEGNMVASGEFRARVRHGPFFVEGHIAKLRERDRFLSVEITGLRSVHRMRPVFPYDSALAAAVRAPAHSIPDVIRTLRTVDAICVDADGLKWFN